MGAMPESSEAVDMTRKWPQWIGYGTAGWSLLYAMLGIWWTLGGAGFPFGYGDPEVAAEGGDAIHASLLGFARPHIAGPIIVVLGLMGALAGTLMARGIKGGIARRALIGFGTTMAVGTAVVIQDYRPLILIAYSPAFLIGRFFGWPPGTSWSDLYTWPRLNLLLCLLAGLGWALTTLAYRRRTAGCCGNCGRDGGAATTNVTKWGKPATVVAIVTPVIYCLTRWAWALGFSLGIDEDFYREGQETGLWLLGAMLATLGLGGAILTLGLVQRWGEIFPRWMIGLRGRRVPPMLAVVPATLVAVLVTAAGLMYIRVAIGTGVSNDDWVMAMPETLWPLWGGALFLAAMAYHRRRRGSCTVCGHG
jgi:hypothetical protein